MEDDVKIGVWSWLIGFVIGLILGAIVTIHPVERDARAETECRVLGGVMTDQGCFSEEDGRIELTLEWDD